MGCGFSRQTHFLDLLMLQSRATLKQRFAVASQLENSKLDMRSSAMGKHGANELNYSSDIDLIVVFDFCMRLGLSESSRCANVLL